MTHWQKKATVLLPSHFSSQLVLADSRPPILTGRPEKVMKETGYNFLYDSLRKQSTEVTL